MPSYAVKQPDGRFAVFSTVVDAFTYANQTREEAIEHWTFVFGRAVALEKIDRAEREADPGDGTPLSRWRDALCVMRLNHSEDEVRETLAEMEQPYTPPE